MTPDSVPILDFPSYNPVTIELSRVGGNSLDELAVQLPRRVQDHLCHHVTGI